MIYRKKNREDSIYCETIETMQKKQKPIFLPIYLQIEENLHQIYSGYITNDKSYQEQLFYFQYYLQQPQKHKS